MVAAPSVSAYPALVAPFKVRGHYLAAASASQSIGYAVGPALGAALFQHAGGGVWVACGVVGGLATVTALAGVRQPGALPQASEGDEMSDVACRVASDAPLRGVLGGRGLAPLVGLLAMLKSNGRLCISTEPFQAVVYFENGAVVGATFGTENWTGVPGGVLARPEDDRRRGAVSASAP